MTSDDSSPDEHRPAEGFGPGDAARALDPEMERLFADAAMLIRPSAGLRRELAGWGEPGSGSVGAEIGSTGADDVSLIDLVFDRATGEATPEAMADDRLVGVGAGVGAAEPGRSWPAFVIAAALVALSVLFGVVMVEAAGSGGGGSGDGGSDEPVPPTTVPPTGQTFAPAFRQLMSGIDTCVADLGVTRPKGDEAAAGEVGETVWRIVDVFGLRPRLRKSASPVVEWRLARDECTNLALAGLPEPEPIELSAYDRAPTARQLVPEAVDVYARYDKCLATLPAADEFADYRPPGGTQADGTLAWLVALVAEAVEPGMADEVDDELGGFLDPQTFVDHIAVARPRLRASLDAERIEELWAVEAAAVAEITSCTDEFHTGMVDYYSDRVDRDPSTLDVSLRDAVLLTARR